LTDVAFDFDKFNSLSGQLGIGLFSLLPGVSAASGLKAAATATASAQRANAKKAAESDSIGIEARLAERRAGNYRRLSSRLDRAVRGAERARDKLLDMKVILSDMRKQIVLSQSDTIDDAQRLVHARTFDQLLGKLNSKVSAGGAIDNLLGSSIRDIFAPEGITYQTKPDSPVTQSVDGIYSGSDYYITDADGTKFFADLYGSVLHQFPFDDTVDGELIAAADTVDYDAETGAISITHAGEPDPFITGTLERKGLGVLHSYLYGKFADPGQRDEALADLDAASAKLRFNIAVMESQLTKVTAQRDFNKKLVDDHMALANKAQSADTVQSTTSSLVAQRQQLLFSSTLQNTLSFDASGTLLSLGLKNMYDFDV
jgi:hypothetical protein